MHGEIMQERGAVASNEGTKFPPLVSKESRASRDLDAIHNVAASDKSMESPLDLYAARTRSHHVLSPNFLSRIDDPTDHLPGRSLVNDLTVPVTRKLPAPHGPPSKQASETSATMMTRARHVRTKARRDATFTSKDAALMPWHTADKTVVSSAAALRQAAASNVTSRPERASIDNSDIRPRIASRSSLGDMRTIRGTSMSSKVMDPLVYTGGDNIRSYMNTRSDRGVRQHQTRTISVQHGPESPKARAVRFSESGTRGLSHARDPATVHFSVDDQADDHNSNAIIRSAGDTHSRSKNVNFHSAVSQKFLNALAFNSAAADNADESQEVGHGLRLIS